MNSTPVVTVLLGAHNAGAFLARSLTSLVDQTFQDWECLMADDGSTDDTLSLLTRYTTSDARFKLFRHTDRLGLTATLIELSEQAKGDYLMRQDADDWSDPLRLEEQLAFLKHRHNCAATASYYSTHAEDEDYIDTARPVPYSFWIRRALRHRNPFAHGSLLFRKSAFHEVGGYRPIFRYAQDYDLLLRLSERYPLGCVPRVLYHLRLSKGSIGSRSSRQQDAYARLARDCSRARTHHIPETPLWQTFKEPASPVKSLSSPYELRKTALDLVRSNQRAKAEAALNQWLPQSLFDHCFRILLRVTNRLPAIARTCLQFFYKLWELV